MAKKVVSTLTIQLPAGAATPAPPVGPALSQHMVNIMQFIKEYNAKTADSKGSIIPAVITVFADSSFAFTLKEPPTTALILKKLGIEKGSQTTGSSVVAKITRQQLREVAEQKMKELNSYDIEAAMNIVMGSARSMGIELEREEVD